MKTIRECALEALELISECANDSGPHEGCSEFDNSDPVELCAPSIRKKAEANGHSYERIMEEVERIEHEEDQAAWEEFYSHMENEGPYGRNI